MTATSGPGAGTRAAKVCTYIVELSTDLREVLQSAEIITDGRLCKVFSIFSFFPRAALHVRRQQLLGVG